MPPPYKHYARSSESVQESYERNNQHTQISYERQVREFKSKSPTPHNGTFPGQPLESRRLPRSNDTDGSYLYTRYDDTARRPPSSTQIKSVGDNKSKGKSNKGGQYIREEFHTEEHYVITRTPLTKNGDKHASTKVPASEQSPPQQQTQELKVICF